MTDNYLECEGCEQEFEERDLNENSLCEECNNQQGIDREESYNDLD